MPFIKNFLNSTKAEVQVGLSETKDKVDDAIETAQSKFSKLSSTVDKFISDGNNQMKIITITAVAIGVSMIISNTVGIFANISNAKHQKDSKVVTNIYIYKGDQKYENKC